MSVHREGVNPSSMDGVPDLRDHNSTFVFQIKDNSDEATGFKNVR